MLLRLCRARFPRAAANGAGTGKDLEAVPRALSIHRASGCGARLLAARSRCPRQTSDRAGLGDHLRHVASPDPTAHRLMHRLDLRTNWTSSLEVIALEQPLPPEPF